MQNLLLAAALAAASVGCAGVRAVDGDGGADAGRSDRDDAGRFAGGRNGKDGGAPGVTGGAPLADAACATHTAQAGPLPLDLYIMLDSSKSMDVATSTGQSKWQAVRAALDAFFIDRASEGIGVALQYFPLPRTTARAACASDAGCGGVRCLTRVCDTGTDLPSDPLTPCDSPADCGGRRCLPVGVCGLTGQVCTAPGQACGGIAASPCAAVSGLCEERDACDAAGYATPAVRIAPLPAARAALRASLDSRATEGMTPTAAALAGALAHARTLAESRLDRRVAVLLATDGLPSECTPADIAGVAAVAAQGQGAAPAVSTFVIGVFSPEEQTTAQRNLDVLAAAGGTGRAVVIDTDQDVAREFGRALASVRQAGLSCQYRVPAAGAGGAEVDHNRVNVQFTPGAGPPVTIGNVPDRAGCHPQQGGWYYDVDPARGTPRTISTCPATCDALRADPAGRVDILLGCRTVIVP